MIGSTRYSYNIVTKSSIYFPAIILSIIAIGMLIVSLISLSFVFEADTEDKIAIVVVDLGMWCFVVMFGLMALIFLNFQPDIKVSQEGLYIQVFMFWWVFAPWESIEAIRPTLTHHILQNSSYVVLVERLTPVHRFFGLNVFSFRPGFLISRRGMKGFDELLNIIKNNVENRQNLSAKSAR